jgi:PAS domain S-box-containing protein
MAEHEPPSSFDQAWSLIVLRSIADAVITSDADDRISFLNPAAEALTGWSLEEAGGRPITEVFRLIDETTGRPIDWPRTEVRRVKSVLLIRRDGRTLAIDDSISPIEDEAGRRSGTVVVFQSIDDRRRAEEELYRTHVELERRVSERTAELAEANAALQGEVAERTRADEELRRANQALRALIHASPLAIIALDGQGRVTIWNPAAERMFGWGNRDVLGHPLPIVPEDLRQQFSSGLATSLQGGAHAGHETLRLKKDGSTIEVSLWTAPLYDARGEPCGRMGVIEDITERKRAEEARTALLRRIVTAQEEERLRIARELHDQMGQHLAALMLGLKATIDHIQNPAAAKEAQRLHDLANRIGQEVHRVSLELRPTALDDWGLQTALTNYAADWSARARIPVQSRFVGIDRRRLPSPVETALYRTVQEALTNVLKHARAARVSLIVERRADQVLAIVEDNGRGFDVEAVMGAPDAGGRLGLLGMQERVALVGGTLEVESRPGGGTSLFIHIPLRDEREAADHG